MTTKIFTYQNTRFEEVSNTGLQNSFGWWQTVVATDINSDGAQDLVIGNIGENFYLRPMPESPVKLWMGDFDNNGSVEGFLTRTVNGKDMPVFLKREVIDQFPALKKDNLKHADYAGKSIQQLFKQEVLAKSRPLQFNYCSSIIAINDGKGHFTIKALPLFAQLSSINAICPADINGDGRIDLLMGGNKFTFPPQFGRLDASYGHLLLNNGGGNFTYIENKKTGINLKGEIKDIKEILTPRGKRYLVAQNDSIPVLYHLKK
jgi:hypothetical protein